MIFSILWNSYFITLLITLVVLIVTYFKWAFLFWKRQNIRFLSPKIPFGNFPNPWSTKTAESTGIVVKNIYLKMKEDGWKYGGVFAFSAPLFVPVDIELIKNILTKDFQYFMDRNIFYDEKSDPLGGHLLNLSGAKWRNMRAKLTPTFTSGKMKLMFQTLVECQNNFQKRLESEVLKNRPVDIKDVLACFTTDVIGSCAFGLDCKAIEEEDSQFRVFGRKMFQPSLLKSLKRTLAPNFPRLAALLKIKAIPEDISSFFINLVNDTISLRKQNNIVRNDFMQLLIDLQKSDAESTEGLSIEQITAQAIVFFAAGFETSSTLMSFVLYELAQNPDIQDKLRKEIDVVLSNHQDKITYDSIQDMKYLGLVIDETLRKHPPAPLTGRKCVKDYKIPNEDVIIKKNTSVLIPIMGIHYDEEYYPNPEKFDPDRFTDENKQLRPSFTHMPFGEGPRNCIGLRFGLMQARVGLVSALTKFKFSPSSKTREPLKMKPSTPILSVDGEVWLNISKVA